MLVIGYFHNIVIIQNIISESDSHNFTQQLTAYKYDNLKNAKSQEIMHITSSNEKQEQNRKSPVLFF